MAKPPRYQINTRHIFCLYNIFYYLRSPLEGCSLKIILFSLLSSASFSNCSVAEGSACFNSPRSWLGKQVKFSSLGMFKNGVQTPWMVGQSVWDGFRYRFTPSPERDTWCSNQPATSSLLMFFMDIQCDVPLRYSQTITGTGLRLGFRYTTTPGFCRLKSTMSLSMKSRIPFAMPPCLLNLIVSLCSWQTYL